MRNYITKLNDRNLQRKKANGITYYVLYSVLIIAIFKTLNIIPKIPFKKNLWEIIEILLYTFNLLFSFIYIYISFISSTKNTSSIRFISNKNNYGSYFNLLLGFILFLFPLIPTALISINTFNKQEVFSKELLSLIVVNSLMTLMIILSFFNKEKPSFKIFDGTKTRTEIDIFVSIITLLISLYITYVCLNSLFFIETTINQMDIFIFGLLIFSIFMIITLILDSKTNDIYTRDLENLEYEIYVKNLDDEQIRNILQERYLGFLVSDWVENNLIEVMEKEKEFDLSKQQLETERKELLKIDAKKYPIEYEGRKNKITKKTKKLNEDIINLFENKIQEIEKIMNRNFKINNSSEKMDLLAYKNKLISEYKKHKK